MNWNKYPFIRLLIAFGAGILLRNAFAPPGLSPKVLFITLLVLTVGEWVLHRRLKTFRYRWTFGVLNLIVFALAGYLRAECSEKMGNESLSINPTGWYVVRVLEPPVEKERSVKVLLDVMGLKTDTTRKVSGKLIGYFDKTEQALGLHYGDMLAFSVPVVDIAPPRNPQEFDYKTYLRRKGVQGSIFLKDGDWLDLKVNHGNPLLVFSYRLRDRMLEALQQCGITEEEFGVAAAILLGYDESLPAQVRQNYVAAGSMHILCVSGMHVGIIYLLASFLLGLLGSGKRMAMIRRWILLALLWLYALITGWSPSILRATLMISFVILGELIHRKGFVLNSIAASAFLILAVNPNNLFAIGFQLSYVAVIGIVLLQRPIYNLVYVKNKLLDKIWEITAVSLAAQIATMPFTVYYFKQFTPYFWLSNLVMTPLSFIVIVSGMVLLLLSWIPWLGMMAGKVVWVGLRAMNLTVSGIESLPCSLVKGLSLNSFQFTICLLLLLLLLLWVNLRKKRMLMELLVASVVLAFSMAWRGTQVAHQSQMVVYSLNRHTAIDFVDGRSHVLMCDRGLLAEPSAIDYSMKGYWADLQLEMNPSCYLLEEDVSHEIIEKRKHWVSFRGKLFAFWEAPLTTGDPLHRTEVDYLMVREKQRPDLKRVLKKYQVGLLLIDGSVPEYLAREWIKQADACGVPYWNIGEKALIINLI